ncbi:hypothetical protein DPMN_187822 [Dreissena polymorpha]|uniref:Uncharacterized protein n=1 Tax=Dreissena polymorpha TaxID=45954 RepID=A0A9D4IAQ8_DREPO|nr:hypothetical protein DPMN_187822 [Dreissena polymorpha]
MLRPRIMKLHRYIDNDWQMTPIDFQVTSGYDGLALSVGTSLQTDADMNVYSSSQFLAGTSLQTDADMNVYSSSHVHHHKLMLILTCTVPNRAIKWMAYVRFGPPIKRLLLREILVNFLERRLALQMEKHFLKMALYT